MRRQWIVPILCLAAGSSVSAETANRIVAVVNDAVITEADVTTQFSAMRDDPEGRLPDDANPSEVQAAILKHLIEQQVIVQEAKRAGIVVSPQEIKDRMDQFRDGFDSEEDFQRSLAEAGVTEDQLRQTVRDQLLVKRVIDAQVRAGLSVSPQEVARQLEQHPELAKPGERVRARHVLVRIGEHRSEDQAQALIQSLSEQLKAGADFAEVAKAHSEDQYREDGGEMDWMAQGELLPELDQALFTLPVGQVSDPIQTRLGFHLVKVEERRSAASLPLTEANAAIMQKLYQQKYQAAFVRWLNDLKRHAYIEILPAS